LCPVPGTNFCDPPEEDSGKNFWPLPPRPPQHSLQRFSSNGEAAGPSWELKSSCEVPLFLLCVDLCHRLCDDDENFFFSLLLSRNQKVERSCFENFDSSVGRQTYRETTLWSFWLPLFQRLSCFTPVPLSVQWWDSSASCSLFSYFLFPTSGPTLICSVRFSFLFGMFCADDRSF